MKQLVFTCAVTIASVSLLSPAQAQRRTFDIPKGEATRTVPEFGRQAGLQVSAPTKHLRGVRTNAVKGQLETSEALRRLLAGTGLEASGEGSPILIIRRISRSDAKATPARAAADPTPPQPSPVASLPFPENPAAGEESSDSDSASIVVTGSRIRGVNDQFSPVRRIDRREIDASGATSLFEVIDNLPQNFGGGITPDSGTTGSTSGPGAATVNLRGLGNEATLVLLDGKRIAPAGALGNYVDISAIPTSAVKRVEVLTDSASAIYGTDAIAGVVNILLREDFNGVETRFGFAEATGGGNATYRVGQTVGFSDDRAHGLITYEYNEENPLLANQKRFSRGKLPQGHRLLPGSKKHSVFAAGGIELSDRVEAGFHAYFNSRDSLGVQSSSDFAVVTSRQSVDVKQAGMSGDLTSRLFGSWNLQLSASYAWSEFLSDTSSTLTTFVNRDTSNTDVLSFDAAADGPLFHLTSEPVRMVVGGHHRAENMRGSTFGRGRLFDAVDRSRTINSAFLEIYAPVVIEADDVPLVHRLAFTAAVRHDDYSDVGSTTNPRFGVAWEPIQSLKLRGTYGTSFRVPRLEQLRDRLATVLALYDDPQAASGRTVALVLQGSRSSLDPEKAKSWTVGFDFRPTWLPPLSIGATYFSIDYTDRVGLPNVALNSDLEFVTDAPVVRSPSKATVQELVAKSIQFINFSDLFPIAPIKLDQVAVLLDARTLNIARSQVRGLDVDLRYAVDGEALDWSAFASATFLTSYRQQATPSSARISVLDTFGQPNSLRLRAGLQGAAKALTGALFINHVGDYRDTRSTQTDFRIGSWTTLDATLGIELGEFVSYRPFKNTSLIFSLTNVFDASPPRLGPRVQGVSLYDPANSDPVGRRFSVLLTKRW